MLGNGGAVGEGIQARIERLSSICSNRKLRFKRQRCDNSKLEVKTRVGCRQGWPLWPVLPEHCAHARAGKSHRGEKPDYSHDTNHLDDFKVTPYASAPFIVGSKREVTRKPNNGFLCLQ